MADADPPRRRVLMVHERYQQAGGEDGVFDAQVALLRARGHDVATVEVDNDAIPSSPSAAQRVRLAVDTVWSRDGVRQVRAAIRAARPDVVHAHNTFPLLSPAIHAVARAEGVATVQTLHNYRMICPSAVLFRDGGPCQDCVGLPLAVPGVVHACYRDSRAASATVAAMSAIHRVRGTWTRDVDRFVALAPFARDRLVHGGLPAARTIVQPNFVDRPGRPLEGVGSGFLYVGRLAVEKGVGVLVDAWRTLPPSMRLTIAGTGPLEALVRAAAEQHPGIAYVGRLDAAGVDAALADARALIVPSLWYEVCPLTVLEAFAAGRPVIASGHGGLADLVEDGVTGTHVRPGDAGALADAVLAAEADPDEMRSRGAAAQVAFRARHTPDRGYAGLVDVYEQALRRRSGRPEAA
ncbi:MAG: glycosyltransferase [Candidatus Limnocylindria bacterium]